MKRVLFVIVLAQFLCTSVWFAGNAILPDLVAYLNLKSNFLSHLTSAVQFGFIAGTLVFALLAIADRYSPSKVFFVSALIAGTFNLAVCISNIPASALLGLRFLTGFFLAGIYPVGMKIASDHFQKGLGKSLGFLVGALVVGTAFPHFLKSLTAELPWRFVIYLTSALSMIGGVLMIMLVSDGPYRKSGMALSLISFLSGFKKWQFRSAALGYFGHMWELYTFWAFVPVILTTWKNQFTAVDLNVPLFSFLIIGSGGLACIFSGLLSQIYKVKTLATIFLFLSGVCCLLSPWFMNQNSIGLLLLFLFFWGLVVIADSPLFSTLVAQQAPEESRGAALTIVNSIGFAITIVSIQLMGTLTSVLNTQKVYIVLAIGPIVGTLTLLSKNENTNNKH